MKTIKKIGRVLALVLISMQSWGQLGLDADQCAKAKIAMGDALLSSKARMMFPGDPNVDVTYYKLRLAIDPASRNISGKVQIDFKLRSNGISTIDIDLNNSFKVNAIEIAGAATTFTHNSNVLKVSLPTSGMFDSLYTVVVDYAGSPIPNLGFYFTTHGNGQPVVWTLSEPFDAPSWWPCIDNPAEKADSCDVIITMPSFYTVASQGLLQSEIINQDGTMTTHWKSRYPIAPYLISIAASNYIKQERVYNNGFLQMPILDYLYPEANTPANRIVLDKTAEMLDVFTEVYGEYPFINEKYGHAMFGFGGGMEHQTMSSMGVFGYSINAHELGHQWFGDKVTCKTWRDIWVNEGFAEFSALYYLQQAFGNSTYQTYVNNHMAGAKRTSNTIAIANPNSVNAIFDYQLTYQKGSIVLHMLRGILGDELFFKVLKEYQTTEFAYDAATIEDFELIAERVTGMELSYFFDEWIRGAGYPQYDFGWKNNDNNSTSIYVAQRPVNTNTVFQMPVEILLNYADGSSEIQTILVDKETQNITLTDLPNTVSTIEFDPNNWILKDLELVGYVEGALSSNPIAIAPKVFPNPVLDQVQVTYPEKIDKVMVKDMLGRTLVSSENEEPINLKYLPAGRYFMIIETNDKVYQRAIVKP